MIPASRIIEQLRTYCTPLNANVAGAAEYAVAVNSQVNLPMPAAYVVPLEDEPEDNILQTGLKQIVRERVAVFLVVSATDDNRGQAAALAVEQLIWAVHKALLNWRIAPERSSKGLQSGPSAIQHWDHARLIWKLEYELLSTITNYDGFQPDADPLQKINITFTEGSMGASINVAIRYTNLSISATAPRPIAAVTLASD